MRYNIIHKGKFVTVLLAMLCNGVVFAQAPSSSTSLAGGYMLSDSDEPKEEQNEMGVWGKKNHIHVYSGWNLAYSNSYGEMLQFYARHDIVNARRMSIEMRPGFIGGFNYIRSFPFTVRGNQFAGQIGLEYVNTNANIETMVVSSPYDSGPELDANRTEGKASMRVSQRGIGLPIALAWKHPTSGWYTSLGLVINAFGKQNLSIEETMVRYENGTIVEARKENSTRNFNEIGFLLRAYEQSVIENVQLIVGKQELFGIMPLGAFIRVEHSLEDQSFVYNSVFDEKYPLSTTVTGVQLMNPGTRKDVAKSAKLPYSPFSTVSMMFGLQLSF